jgi:hypothetical protein
LARSHRILHYASATFHCMRFTLKILKVRVTLLTVSPVILQYPLVIRETHIWDMLSSCTLRAGRVQPLLLKLGGRDFWAGGLRTFLAPTKYTSTHLPSTILIPKKWIARMKEALQKWPRSWARASGKRHFSFGRRTSLHAPSPDHPRAPLGGNHL